MTIAEPLTTLTDYAIAVESTIFAVQLLKIRQISVWLWAGAFLMVAIAAGLGGTLHGFGGQLELVTRLWLWKGTFYAVGLSSLLLLMGTLVSAIAYPWRLWWLLAVGVKSLLYMYWATRYNAFAYVVADYLSALVIVLILQVRVVFRFRSPTAYWFIAGVVISGLAALILQCRFVLIAQIRSVDIYHLVQMLALYCFYRGANRLKDR